LNGKQRVRLAIARQCPDRVPLGLYAIDCDTAGRILGRKTLIRDKPGIQLALWQGRRKEVAESLKVDVVELFSKLDVVDVILFKEAQVLPPADYEPRMPRKIGEDLYEDDQARVWQLSWLSNDVTMVKDPGVAPPAVYTPQMFPMADPAATPRPDPSCYEVFDHMAAHLGSDHYIASCTGGLKCMPLPGGMEHGLMQYALAPDAMAAAARREASLAELRDEVAVRRGCDGVFIEEDMAGSNGLLISPSQWREICRPALSRRVADLKRRAGQVTLHCCGRTLAIMEDLIDCGVDCYQSLQTLAGMAPENVCPQFGDRMAFWGGAPVELLVGGSPAEMREAVRRTMQATAAYPGFIFGPSHSVAFGTKYDNFMAMLDEFDRLAAR